ncbi:MAG: pyridoxal-phosphate dependent enzyme, partial [Actinomycetia bacterium]|nr:pyridoxal-phosphate dependent enzyme [Actinomycetes bacterium]
MKSIDEAIAGIPRRHHSVLPTPIHELTALSDQFGGRVFCKRDDLTGFGFGGNKSRKLDFLVDDAITRQCDTLLTVGANQSNFCRMVAAYGSVNEMDVHLVLGGAKPAVSTGNLRLDHMLRANCHHVDSNEWDVWESEARALETKLTNDGRRVYRMPVGGSTPIGALGYVAAMSEIIDDEARLGVHFDAIVFASSSAGTQAGLVIGKSIAKWPGEIIGMSVAKDKKHQYED